MPKLLATRKLPEPAEAAVRAKFEVKLNQNDKSYSTDELLALAEGCDGIVLSSFDKFGADLIEKLPASVKILATVSVGYEHIDLAAARARGIAVTNTPDVLTDATADVSMLLMLGAARGAADGMRRIADNRWPPASLVANLWHDVSGARLGILGMGRIGQAVAGRAQGFGMTLHYHNRKHVSPELAHGATYHAKFEDMLPHIDFLSINCAMTPETKHLVNARTIAKLPRGAIIVNAARGGVIHDDALIDALQTGHIAAAGLDVFNNEPAIDPRYRNLPTVFALPHIGSATLKTRAAMGLRAVANVVDFFEGKRPRDLLN